MVSFHRPKDSHYITISKTLFSLQSMTETFNTSLIFDGLLNCWPKNQSVFSNHRDMTKIAPAVLEDIQNQVDSIETINVIEDQEDSSPPIPDIQRTSKAEAGRK